MVRLRFSKTVDGDLVTKTVVGNGTTYFCTIQPQTHTLTVTDDVTGEVVETHICVDTTQAKRLAREVLVNLGVTFNDEVRQRKVNVVTETDDEALTPVA
jgi:hypothetical protein